MFNTFNARTSVRKISAKNIILACCLGLFAHQSWADDKSLEIKISIESTSMKIDRSTEITAFVSKEKIPASNAKLRWTQLQGPGKASLFPGKGKTNTKGMSQLRVQAHNPGKYTFLAEACGESNSKAFAKTPSKPLLN